MSLASRTTGGGSPEEARRVAEVDVTFAGAGGAASAGADVVVGADSAVATDVVAGADPMGGAGAAAVVGLPVLPDEAAAAGAGGVTVVADVDRVNPGGVSGGKPNDCSPVALVEVESVPGADRADVVEVKSRAAAIEVAAAAGEVDAADLGEVCAAAPDEVAAAATGAAAG